MSQSGKSLIPNRRLSITQTDDGTVHRHKNASPSLNDKMQ